MREFAVVATLSLLAGGAFGIAGPLAGESRTTPTAPSGPSTIPVPSRGF